MFQAPIIPPFPAGATPSGHPMINQLAAVMANRPNSTSLNSQTQSIPMRTSPSTSMPVPSSTGCSVGSTHSSPSPNGGGNKDMFPSQSTSNQNQIAQYINQVNIVNTKWLQFITKWQYVLHCFPHDDDLMSLQLVSLVWFGLA